MYRQGDILLVPVKKNPWGSARRPMKSRVVVAPRHVVEAKAVGLDVSGSWAYLTVGSGGALLRHPEHAAIRLPAGSYRVIRQREFFPAESGHAAD